MTTQDSQSFQWKYDQLSDKNFQIHGRTLFFIIVLFSLILLITLVFLYARWIVSRSSSASSAAVSNATTSSPHVQTFTKPQGLDSAVIDSLPITLHQVSTSSATNNESDECCICLGVFEEGEKVKALPMCSHCYHSECVDTWLTTHSSCPICRAVLLVDDSPV